MLSAVSETVRSANVTDILEAHAGRSKNAAEFQGYPENYHMVPAQFDSRKQEEIAGRQMRREGPIRGFTALLQEATYCCSSVRLHIVQDVFDGLAPSDFAALPCRHDAKPYGLQEQVLDGQRSRSHKEHHQYCLDIGSALPCSLRTCRGRDFPLTGLVFGF